MVLLWGINFFYQFLKRTNHVRIMENFIFGNHTPVLLLSEECFVFTVVVILWRKLQKTAINTGLCRNLQQLQQIAMAKHKSGARLTKAYDVTIQRYRNSHAKNEDIKMHILRCMGSKFCVKFQRCPLKFHTKFWTHTPQNMHFTRWYKFDDLWYLRDMTS